MITIDMIKARQITKERLRLERIPLLESLDVQFMRNIEAGVDNSAVAAEKERLRHITDLADAATTLEELKALKA